MTIDWLAHHKAVLDELKANDPGDGSFDEKIAIYTSAIEELENPPSPPGPSAVDEVEARASRAYHVATLPAWDASTDYTAGDQVVHNDVIYVAMEDVQTGVVPDDVYDLDTETGGWIPLSVLEDTA